MVGTLPPLSTLLFPFDGVGVVVSIIGSMGDMVGLLELLGFLEWMAPSASTALLLLSSSLALLFSQENVFLWECVFFAEK